MAKSYNYLIGWRNLDKWYYGCRTANRLPPAEDLWSEYFTSSEYVKEMRRTHGEPDTIRVVREFDNHSEALLYETRFIKRVRAVKNQRWLNRGCCGEDFYNSTPWNKGLPRTPEVKEKIRQANLGKTVPNETRRKQSEALKGRTQSVTHIQNRMISLKGRNKGFSGKKHSEETKQKIREARLKRNQNNGQ